MIHLLSVEDPVEYRLSANSSCITQREVGRDCVSLHEGLVQAMREDPDALFIGEIRTQESLEVAMQAAETGHAVFSSFHTGSALKTVMRVISMYPADEQLSARARLADCLRAVVCQMLVARKGANARVLTTEVMVNNYRVKECIRDPSRTAALPQVLEKSREQGMHTFDEDMLLMVRDGIITVDTALAHASSPNDLRRALSLAGVAA
jgi:twitching motility protein PilT